MWGLWTEHEVGKDGKGRTDRMPEGAEISEMIPGLTLTPSGKVPSSFVLRAQTSTLDQARALLDKFHAMGWTDWLASLPSPSSK